MFSSHLLICYSLELQKLLNAPDVIESSPTTLLDTTMRQNRLVMHAHLVDMYCAAVNLFGYPKPRAQVRREDGPREPVLGVVGNLNGLVFRLKGDERDAGTKGLGVVDVHVLLDVCDDKGSDAVLVVLLAEALLVAEKEFGAFGRRVCDQFAVLLDGWLSD